MITTTPVPVAHVLRARRLDDASVSTAAIADQLGAESIPVPRQAGERPYRHDHGRAFDVHPGAPGRWTPRAVEQLLGCPEVRGLVGTEATVTLTVT